MDKQGRREEQTRPDVVVVGGGIVGLSAAYELSKRGLSVCLLERALLGAAQSTQNWGFVRQQGRMSEELPLMQEANGIWQGLEQELGQGIDWIQGGVLRLTKNPQEATRYQQWIEQSRECGLETRVVTEKEVLKLVNGLRDKFLFGAYTPSDGQASPSKTVSAYANAIHAAGVDVRQHCGATAIVTSGGRVTGVLSGDGLIGTSTVICAAGVGSRKLLRTVGLDVPVQVVRETVALTMPVPPVTSACVWTGEIGFRQTRSGQFVVSVGGEGDIDLEFDSLQSVLQLPLFLPMYLRNRHYFRPGRRKRVVGALRNADHTYDLSAMVNVDDVASSLHALARYLPSNDWKLASAWAGRIDGTPDSLPIIEVLQSLTGLVVATGFSGHGFGIAPAVGRALADLVTKGESAHDLRPFRTGRFSGVSVWGKARKLL